MDAASTPENCPTCGTRVPAGAEKCPACGSVFGEANRCPHCHAVAAVRPTSSGGHVCMACGKPRSLGPGVTVFRPPANRVVNAGKRSIGIFAIAAGLIGAAAVAAVIPGVLGLAAAAGIAGVGLFAGLRGFGGSSSHEGAIMALAEEHEGALYVSDVAKALRISPEDADAALTAMTDGSRVVAEITSDGLIRYEFRELRARRDDLRVRVADPLEERFAALEAQQEELAAAEGEVEALLSSRDET